MNHQSLTTPQARSATDSINAGPWTDQQRAWLLKAVSDLTSSGKAKYKYKAQHLLNFHLFVSSSKHAKIIKNDAPLEHYLDLAAQQFVELECVNPCEKTVGRAVSALMDLTDASNKYNAAEKVSKVELLKNFIKFHIKARGTHE
jgi:hypothetical protein